MESTENQNTKPIDAPKNHKINTVATVAIVVAALMTFATITFAVLFFTSSATKNISGDTTAATGIDNNASDGAEQTNTGDNTSEQTGNSQPNGQAEAPLARPFLFSSDNILNGGDSAIAYEIATYGDMVVYVNGNSATFYLPPSSYIFESLRDYFIGDRDDLGDTHTISFSQPVASADCLGFGQAAGEETLFFVMADGTVEYMPVFHAYINNKFESYGKVPGVENVVTVRPASAKDIESHSGWGTNLAFRSDGRFYDLAFALEAFNNDNPYYGFKNLLSSQ